MGREKDDTTGIKHGKPDLIRIGMFSEPLYISSGEAFTSKKVSSLDYRANGKQFQTAPMRKGHDTKDVYFNQTFVRLFENEPYMDLVKLRRSWRLQAKEKNIVSVPFKPSSVPSKPSGKGSHWGTIQQQFPIKGNEAFALPPKPEVKEEKKKELKNFLTAPSKKGSGYGYSNVTIGNYYAYESDPYDRRVIAERNERNESKKRMVENKAFVSQTASHEYFNPFARLTKPEDAAKKEANEEQAKKKPVTLAPFKPSSAFGYTINPYPVYEPPKAAPKTPPSVGKNMIFKPSGVTGSFPVRSIIESNTPIAPPPWVKAMQEKVHLGSSSSY